MKPIRLDQDTIGLGRAPECRVQILGDGKVSRHHAEIRREGDGFALHDMGSENGTFVNGERITRHTLAEGDRIRLGETHLGVKQGALWVPENAVVGAGVAMESGTPATGIPALPLALVGIAALLLVSLLGFALWNARSKGGVVDGAISGRHLGVEATVTSDGVTSGRHLGEINFPTDTPPPTALPSATPTPGSGNSGGSGGPSPTHTPTINVTTGTIVHRTGLFLADYYAWYNRSDWDSGCISDDDAPLDRYDSDDPGTIQSQIDMASGVGIDGFTLQWEGPGERTDRNFKTLLDKAGGGFKATIGFEQHVARRGSQQDTIDALRYIRDSYTGHGSFLRVDGRPIIFFVVTDNPPRSGGQSAVDAWRAIRGEVDPQRQMWWIAEGDDSRIRDGYLDVFDGLYTYKISHAGAESMVHAYRKLPRYAVGVRKEEQRTGQPKLWVGSIASGWDDINTAKNCTDFRQPSAPHRVDRGDGAFYRNTFNAAMQSGPDILYLVSFNEWREGHYIEPSEKHGRRYLDLTGEFASAYGSR